MSMDPAGRLTTHRGFYLTAGMPCGRMVGLLRPMSPQPIAQDANDER